MGRSDKHPVCGTSPQPLGGFVLRSSHFGLLSELRAPLSAPLCIAPSRRWDAAGCATTSTRCGAGSVASARWCGRVRRSSSWSCHPIAYSAAVPPKFEPSAIGIRALDRRIARIGCWASVTPIRRPCANFRVSTEPGQLHARQNGDVAPRPKSRRRSSPGRWSTDGSSRASRRRR